MAFATISGVENWYDITGSGFPLVIIGGFALGHYQGEAVTPLLTPNFKVIQWDMRGQGLSDRSLPDQYGALAWAGDLKRLLDHLGIQRAHVWGTSTGSMIAVQFAASYPERIGGLVTHPSFTGEKIRHQMLMTYSSIVEFFGIRAMVRVLVGTLGLPLEVLHSSQGREIEDWITAKIEGNLSLENYLTMCRIFANADITPELPNVQAPTLILTGTAGPIGRKALNDLILNIQKTLPGSQVKAIEGGGTAFMVQRPAETAAAVTDFLRQVVL